MIEEVTIWLVNWIDIRKTTTTNWFLDPKALAEGIIE